jgi:hypothetical protein
VHVIPCDTHTDHPARRGLADDSVGFHTASSAASERLPAYTNQSDPLKQLQEHLTEQLKQTQKLIAANEGDNDAGSELDDAEVRSGEVTDRSLQHVQPARCVTTLIVNAFRFKNTHSISALI